MSTAAAAPVRRAVVPRLLRAEIASLTRRPGVRAAVLVWCVQILAFAYGIQYVVQRALGADFPPAEAEAVLASMALADVGPYVAASVPGYGLPVFVLIGALAGAGDHRWGTIRTIVARVPDRGSLVLARFGAVALVCEIAALLSTVVGVVASLALSAVEGLPVAVDAPSLALGVLTTAVGGFGYAAVGLAAGLVLRSVLSSAAVVLGWVAGLELLLVGTLAPFVPALDAVRHALLSPAVGSLVAASDLDGSLVTQGLPGSTAVMAGWTAVLVIAVWGVAAWAVATRVFGRRDLTG